MNVFTLNRGYGVYSLQIFFFLYFKITFFRSSYFRLYLDYPVLKVILDNYY